MEYLWCTHYSWVSWHSSFFFSHSLFALALLVCSRASINRCIFMWIVCNCNVDAVCMRQTSRDRYDEKYSKNSLVRSTDDASNIVECQRFGIFSTSSSSSCCNFFSLLLMRKRSEEKRSRRFTNWRAIGVSAPAISERENAYFFTNHKRFQVIYTSTDASVSNGTREIAYASFKWFVFGFASSHQRTFDKTMSSAECQKQMQKYHDRSRRRFLITTSYWLCFKSFRVIHTHIHTDLFGSRCSQLHSPEWPEFSFDPSGVGATSE